LQCVCARAWVLDAELKTAEDKDSVPMAHQQEMAYGLPFGIIQIYPWMAPVDMATKFETKVAITRRSLRLVGDFRVGLLNDIRQILPRLTSVAMAMKFWTKNWR